MLLIFSLLFLSLYNCGPPQQVSVCSASWPGCKYTGMLGLKNALALEISGTTINVYEGTYYGGLITKYFNIVGSCGLYPGYQEENITKNESPKKRSKTSTTMSKTKIEPVYCFATVLATSGASFTLGNGASGTCIQNIKMVSSGPAANGIQTVASSIVNDVSITNNNFINLQYGVFVSQSGASGWIINQNSFSVKYTGNSQFGGIVFQNTAPSYTSRNVQTMISGNSIVVIGSTTATPGYGIILGYGFDTNSTVSNNNIQCSQCSTSIVNVPPAALTVDQTLSSGILLYGAYICYVTGNSVLNFPANLLAYSTNINYANSVYVTNNEFCWGLLAGAIVQYTASSSDAMNTIIFTANTFQRNLNGVYSNQNSGSQTSTSNNNVKLAQNNFVSNVLDLNLDRQYSFIVGNLYTTCNGLGCP